MKLSDIGNIEIAAGGDKYLSQEELDQQNKKSAPLKLSQIGKSSSPMKLSQIGKAQEQDDNALEDTLNARKKQLEDQQKAAYAKEQQIAAQEAEQNKPENWSSTRFKKEAPKPQTPEEQGKYDAVLEQKKVKEEAMTQALLPPELRRDELEIGPPKPDKKQTMADLGKIAAAGITGAAHYAAEAAGTYKPDPVLENAKAQNVYAISQSTGIPLSEVAAEYKSLVRRPEITGINPDTPTFKEFIGIPLTGAVTMGLMSNPIGVALGIAGFMALDEIENKIVSTIKKRPYILGAGRGLSDLLPEQATEATKSVVDLVDLVGKGLLLGGIGKRAPKISEFLTKQIINKYNLPKDVYIDPVKIRGIFGTPSEEGVKITPEELDLVKGLGLDAKGYKEAFSKGITIKVPVEKITTLADRPYWKALKEAIGLKSGPEVKISRPEKVAGKTGKTPLKLSEIPGEKIKIDAKIDTGSGELKGAVQRIRGVLNKAGIYPGMVDALIKTGAKKEAVAKWIQGVAQGKTDDVFSVRFNEDLTALIDGKGVLEPSGEKPPVMPEKQGKTPIVEAKKDYERVILEEGGTFLGVTKGFKKKDGTVTADLIQFRAPSGTTLAITSDKITPDLIRSKIADAEKLKRSSEKDEETAKKEEKKKVVDTREMIKLYRGGREGGNFYSPDPEFAKQFTQSGKDSELKTIEVDDNEILDFGPYTPEANNVKQMDDAIAKTKAKGAPAFYASEGKDLPRSVFFIEGYKSQEYKTAGDVADAVLKGETPPKETKLPLETKEKVTSKQTKKYTQEEVSASGSPKERIQAVREQIKESRKSAVYSSDNEGMANKAIQEYRDFKAEMMKKNPKVDNLKQPFPLEDQKALDAAFEKLKTTIGTVHIAIPGDGEFDILLTHEALDEFESKLKKIEPTLKAPTETKDAGIAVAKPTAVPKVASSVTNAVAIKNAFEAASDDTEKREIITGVHIDKSGITATNGRILYHMDGSFGKEGTYARDGKKIDGDYPNYIQVIPKPKNAPVKNIDVVETISTLNKVLAIMKKDYQGDPSADNPSVALYLNENNTIGYRWNGPTYGSFEENLNPGAKLIGAFNPQMMKDLLTIHALNGSGTVDMGWSAKDQPILMKGEKDYSILMPMNSEYGDFYYPPGSSSKDVKAINKKAKGTSAVGYPMPTEFPEEPGSPGAPISGNRPVRLERPAGVTGSVEAPEIIKAMEELMRVLGGEVPIRRGRFNQKALGIFKVLPEVVRLLTANDLPTALHETFHGVEKLVYGWSKGGAWKKPLVSPEIQKELMDLGKALYGSRNPAGGYKREGWAEFGRIWITDRAEAALKAPQMTQWFENAFLNDLPDAAKQIRKIVGMLKTWNQMGSVARAKASMVDTGSVKREIKAAKTSLQNFASMEKWIDMLEPINRMAREAEEQLGRKLDPMEDPGFIATALRTTHDARTRVMVEEHMIDLAGNVVGPPLADIRAIVQGKKDEFSIYLWAKRAEALWNDKKNGPRNPGLSMADARQIITELETPQFQLAAQKVYDWNESVLNYAAQGSPTFRVAVEKIRANSSGYYVPLQRVFEELDTRLSKMGGSGSKAMSGSLSKRLKGSGRQIKDIFPQMIANTRAMVKATHNRMVIDAMLKLSKVEGMGHLVEKVPKSKVPVQIQMDQVIRELQKAGIEVDGMEPGEMSSNDHSGEMLTFFTEAQFPSGKDLIVPIFEGGKVVWYQFDPELYQALKSMEVYRLPQTGSMLDLVGTIFSTNARIFRTMTTGMRASFSLMTNWMRDLPTFLVQTKSHANPGQLLYSWLGKMGEGLVRATTGKTLPYTDMFIRLGGEMAQPLGQDIAHTRRAARRLFEGKVTRIIDFRNWWDGIRDILQFPELATRTAELEMVAKDIGWRQGTPITLEQSLQLLTAIKQVTTDFSAGGEFAKTMNEIIPFFNAAIQGPRAGWRAYKRNPAGFIAKGLGTLTAIMLFNWWKNKDKEWRKELSPGEKYMFTWFEINLGGRKELIKIPRPFELGQIFMSAPEALLDAWYEKDPQAVKDWFSVFKDASTPGLLPPIAQETLAQAANQDMFWKTPIVSQGMERKPASEQYNEYTSKAAIFLGKLFSKKDEAGNIVNEGISPQRIDHAIRGLTGAGSMDIIKVLGLGGKSSSAEKEPADLPVAGVLFKRGGPLGTRPVSVSKLYDLRERLGKQQASSETIETSRAKEMRLLINDASTAISALSFIRRKTDSVDEKRAITDQTLEIAKDALQNYHDNSINRFRFKTSRKRAEKQKKRIQDYEASS